MNSSQESDISVETFATAEASSKSTQSTLSSQDEAENDVLDGWRRGQINVEINGFDNRHVGPKHRLADDASPLDFFRLYWTDHLTDLIVTETNR